MSRRALAILPTSAALLVAGLAPAAAAQAVQTAFLSPPGLQTDDRFAITVSLDGDVAAMGAPNTDPATQHDQGSAFVYRFDGTSWNLEAELVHDDPQNDTHFGSAVAIEGDRLVVGIPFRDFQSGSDEVGAVSVFEKSGCCWTQVTDVVPPSAQTGDGCGSRVLLRGDRMFVTGAGRDGSVGQDEGVVFVLTWDGASWNEEALLFPSIPTAGGFYGTHLAVDGTTLVAASLTVVDVWELQAGAWTHVQALQPALGSLGVTDAEVRGGRVFIGDSSWPGTEGTEGRVLVYEHDGSSWALADTLISAAPFAGEHFGWEVAPGHELLLVSTLADSVHVLDRTTSGWVQRELIAETGAGIANFGSVMEVEHTRALIGAPTQEVGGGPPFNEGAAYVYELGSPPADTYCTGKTSSLGCMPFLATEGLPSVTSASPFRIRAHDVIPGEAGFLVYGSKKANLSFHGGKLCVKSPLTRWLPPKIAANTGTPPCSGVWTRNFNNQIQAGADPQLTAGFRAFVQLSQRDPADPAGFGDSLTDAATFVIAP